MREATTIVGILQEKIPEFIAMLRVMRAIGNWSVVLSEGAGNVMKVSTIIQLLFST